MPAAAPSSDVPGAPALREADALHYLEGLSRFGIRLGLERMRRLLAALGHPERRLRVIHVAGTNGKGSTSALLAAVLQAAGHRTGLYTSPHLHDYRERIHLDGQPIPPGRLAHLVTGVREIIETGVREGHDPPTEFEAGTAVMYQYFAEEGAEVVVQEAGLGGRLDATNVVERPLVTVVTSIGMDHTDRLGGTLADIAGEKAGIGKPGVPMVSAPQAPAAEAVLAAACESLGSRLIRVGREVSAMPASVTAEGTVFDYRGLGVTYRGLRLGLLGPHQVENAGCALAALEVAARHGLAAGEAAVRAGLAGVRWPGRLEVLRRSPLVVLDGAHNPGGALALRHALQALWPGTRFVLVLGVLDDKDGEGIVRELAPCAAGLVTTRPDSPRALPPEALAGRGEALGLAAAVEPDPARAVQRALALAGEGGAVCVAGSLYLAGSIRPLFEDG